jgi:hypothetical protein
MMGTMTGSSSSATNKQPTAKDDIADIRCFGSIPHFLAAVLEVLMTRCYSHYSIIRMHC